ncbi:MAG TPA: cyanophycinase [Candidatus Acidoferrales bacterium]|nr:cyanophycinase [Candidatus Acidoferrales bacterium]
MWTRPVIAALFALQALGAQASSGPMHGTLIADGGGGTDLVKDRFVSLAGGVDANIVVIPTGASSLRFGPDKTILDPDWPRDRPEWAAYRKDLTAWFGTAHITILHTRDRAVADSEEFAKPLRTATGVFLGAGNAGRIARSYLGTRTQQELQALLDRGGVVLGSSAGSIVLGSFIVRGWPEKPLLMAPGHDRGFGFLRNVAINPHLTEAKRDYELINVVDAHPEILGIGIDEPAAIVVQGNRFEVIGTGKVAIYDNQPHPGAWYYWLNPGDRFDLARWQKIAP